MKRELLIRAFSIFTFCLGFMPNTTFAQVQDNAIDDVGDIAFIAYASRATNNAVGFAFVLLDNCPNNTSIYFTDEEWTGASFASAPGVGEGDITWTNNTGNTIPRGTVIKMVSSLTTGTLFGTSTNVVNIGSVTTSSGIGTADGDQMYATTGLRSGTFLAFVGGITTTSLSFNGTPFGSGTAPSASLTAYGKNVATGSKYAGSTICNGTAAQCNTMINTGTWNTTSFTGLTTTAAFFAAIPNFFTGSALPVELTAFAVNTEGGKANLTWTTASEKGNAYFAIEHATNGVDFREIAQVKGNGTTSQVSKYQYTHTTPAAGANYYRLRQVDADGNATYSAVRFVSVGIKGTASVFPTVGQNDITLITDNTDAAQNYEVYDMLGAIVMSGTVQGQKTLNISTLSRGMYVVKISGNTLKFIKD